MKDFRAPNEPEAAERSWQVARAAYETRTPVSWPRRHARPLVAGALVAAAVAAVLSPPGRSVVHSLRKAVGVEHAETTLFSLPAQGRLLVTGRGGTWIVRADGSRRRLGDYQDASWSPHGIFVAATHGNELVALDQKGNVRWTLARRSPRSPTWTGTRTDTRIAYLSGGRLHVVAGDGTGDYVVGKAAQVAPAWRHHGTGRMLAYARPGRVIVYSVDARAAFLIRRFVGARKLEWSDDGRLLLVLGPRGVRVLGLQGVLFSQDRPPTGSVDVDAAFVPGSHRVAVIRATRSASKVALMNTRRNLFGGTGVFRQIVFSPGGRWLMITWPTANQWVFFRSHPRKIVGAARISNQFGGYPRIASWCCAR